MKHYLIYYILFILIGCGERHSDGTIGDWPGNEDSAQKVERFYDSVGKYHDLNFETTHLGMQLQIRTLEKENKGGLWSPHELDSIFRLEDSFVKANDYYLLKHRQYIDSADKYKKQ